jgi:RimJ/RimL family protein N-acetyltransferase
MPDEIFLRNVIAEDLPIFFENQQDPEANYMAAFTAKDPADWEAFCAHWDKILSEPTIAVRTIVCLGKVAGHILSYEENNQPEVSYWTSKLFWGRGIATQALDKFLKYVNPQRPIYARVAKDNRASLRVLQKCGFKIIGESKGFAHARGREVEEWILELTANETKKIDRDENG